MNVFTDVNSDSHAVKSSRGGDKVSSPAYSEVFHQSRLGGTREYHTSITRLNKTPFICYN